MSIVNHQESIITVNNVSFSYDEVAVLERINLSIHRGDYLGIVGPNGAGKTTLAKLMLGLLTPQEGSISLFGVEMKHFNEWSRIGYVPQFALGYDRFFPATVGEVVLMGRYGKCGLLHRITKEDKRAAEHALEQVGMSALHDRLLSTLSGGQQQRVFIARALASEPEILFLDEPVTGVDTATQQDFYALLNHLNHTEQVTLVLVSHDLEVIAREAMHIACIDRTLVYHGSPEEYIRESFPLTIGTAEVKVLTHHHAPVNKQKS